MKSTSIPCGVFFVLSLMIGRHMLWTYDYETYDYEPYVHETYMRPISMIFSEISLIKAKGYVCSLLSECIVIYRYNISCAHNQVS